MIFVKWNGFFLFLGSCQKIMSQFIWYDVCDVISNQWCCILFVKLNVFFNFKEELCTQKYWMYEDVWPKKWLILRKSISRIKWSHTLIFFYFWLYSQILSSLGYCASSIKSERHWWIGEFDRQCFESLIMSYHTCEKSP